MTKEEFAKLLDGRGYGEEITEDEEVLAKKNDLVVVFGYSDDNVELRGAINDEVGTYEGGQVRIDKEGVISPCECNCECRKCRAETPIFRTIYAHWDYKGYSWFIDLEYTPFASFEIFEDVEGSTVKFCRGIVFNISDL